MKKDLYKELINKQSKEVNNFPMMFAFSDLQFNEGMIKLGLDPKDINKIISIGSGGFVKKTDLIAVNKMGERHAKELKENIENDKNGQGYVYDMFHNELINHEYDCTYDVKDALNSLNLTEDDINKDFKLKYALNKACNNIKREESDY